MSNEKTKHDNQIKSANWASCDARNIKHMLNDVVYACPHVGYRRESAAINLSNLQRGRFLSSLADLHPPNTLRKWSLTLFYLWIVNCLFMDIVNLLFMDS